MGCEGWLLAWSMVVVVDGCDKADRAVAVLEKDSEINISSMSEKEKLSSDTVLTDEVRVVFNIRDFFKTFKVLRISCLSLSNLHRTTRQSSRKK